MLSLLHPLVRLQDTLRRLGCIGRSLPVRRLVSTLRLKASHLSRTQGHVAASRLARVARPLVLSSAFVVLGCSDVDAIDPICSTGQAIHSGTTTPTLPLTEAALSGIVSIGTQS